MYQSPYGAWLLVERIGLMLVALLAPEVILTVAFIEWIAAVIVTAGPPLQLCSELRSAWPFVNGDMKSWGLCVLCYRLL